MRIKSWYLSRHDRGKSWRECLSEIYIASIIPMHGTQTNANGGTDYGEFPVIATLSLEITNTILGGDRGFGNAGGARNNFNFMAGADTIT